ncbi:hypothetical protein ACFL6U_08290 [Planctomycetota bacterium]
MKSLKDIQNIVTHFRVKPTLEMRSKVLNEALEMQKYRKQRVISCDDIWRKFIEMKATRKVVILGCLVLVSIATAVVAPNACRTVQSFLSAFNQKQISDLVELVDPMSAVQKQMEDLRNIEIEGELKLVSLHIDTEYAISITSDVVEDHSQQQGPLVITLAKQDDRWLVTDIDLETEKTAKEELNRFLKRYPNATEVLPTAATRPSSEKLPIMKMYPKRISDSRSYSERMPEGLGSVVVEGILSNRDKFECGILAWSTESVNPRYNDPRGKQSGQYELWWDGKKIATKYTRDFVYSEPTGGYYVKKERGGKSYDGSLLSRKPRFDGPENWFLLTGWKGDRSLDWKIKNLNNRYGFSHCAADGKNHIY